MEHANGDSIAELERAHPGWHIWRGVTGGLYARRINSSPPVTYLADTFAELEARIIGHEERRQW
jgi:hypothetical protein